MNFEDNFKKKEGSLNKEALRSLLLCFSDKEGDEVKSYQLLNKLIKENPKEYKFYQEVIRPLMNEYSFNDEQLEKYPKLFKIFSEISLTPLLEREWVEIHLKKKLKNQLPQKVKIYYDTLIKKLNLDKDESFNDLVNFKRNEIEKEKIEEKIIGENPDILEENAYKYLTEKLSKKEWQDYVNEFLDDPKKLKVLKEIQEEFDHFKHMAHMIAKDVSGKDAGSEEYKSRYEDLLRSFIKGKHIDILNKNA